MRKIVLIGVAMIVGLLAASASAYACCGHCGSGHSAMMGSGHADRSGMQLDSDQQARIAAIRSKYNGDFTKLRSEMKEFGNRADQ
ncbi:MAG: hypothetical protein M5R36_08420 [Deltaproteobacteria bacterium]|nr:hypothetical protein [Deltaproteobacteria bacterium]